VRGKYTRKTDADEWVECVKCSKWRRLPSHVAYDSLPEEWECFMTNWESIFVNCLVDEEVDDSRDTRGGGGDGGGVSVPHVLSYRALFGLSNYVLYLIQNRQRVHTLNSQQTKQPSRLQQRM
jgi:hypothetical protein